MTIRRLRTLVAIADTDTFSEAADVVHITHAAVSQQMQSLEADLGIKLFDRSTRTPRLTPVARQIVAKARRLISEYENLVPSVLDDDGLHGVIKLGVLRTTLTGLVPQAMAALKSKFPQIGLHIRPGLTSTLLAEIERGNLDAAITTKPHVLPSGVVFRELAQEPMQLIAAMEEPGDDPVALLKTRPFIRFDRTAVVGALIENWILSKRIQVNEMMELDSPEAIASMVHANLGVSIVPDLVVQPPVAVPVKRLDLGPDAPHRTLGLVHQKDQLKTKALEELFEALLGVVRAANPGRAAADQ
jgi:DNA-binding transcriptional LysR family regulator